MTTQINTLRRREKFFGEGRCVPIDRNAKAYIWAGALTLKRRVKDRQTTGKLTAKCLDVLWALLFKFHNAATGRCFPSYERIAEAAECHRDTAIEAVKALEAAGLLSWVNRIVRVWEEGIDLFGRALNRRRVKRTSNQYYFNDPKPKASKSEFPARTRHQVFTSSAKPDLDPDSPLEKVLSQLGAAVKGEAKRLAGVEIASSVPKGMT